MKMELTSREKNLVQGIIGDLLSKPYNELNKTFGTETIQEMANLYSRMRWDDYCKRHNVKYEDLTEDDYEQAYREEWES